jgi:energy-converting hydrogenase Eha subunit H
VKSSKLLVALATTTTLDIYAHVTPGMQKEAALRFEEALKQAGIEGAIEVSR